MNSSLFHLATVISAGTLVASLHASGVAPLPRPGGRPDTLVANPQASSIRWSGSGVGGTVGLASGTLVIRHEMLERGSFIIDMPSLAVSDVPAGGRLTRRAARAQLTGAGAFDVDRHPTVTFVSSAATRTGPSRWRVTGQLTMHGVTRPLSVDADVRWAEPGHMVATASFALKPSAWDVGAELAGDEMRVAVTLDARRKASAVAVKR